MRISFIFMVTMILLSLGCKIDSTTKKDIAEEDLIGEWEIFYATRNGNVTKSLEKGNFVFQADNLVSSNLFGGSNSLNFTFDGSTIAIKGDPNVNTLKVIKIQNDTMVLSSKMKVFDMEFYLTKQ